MLHMMSIRQLLNLSIRSSPECGKPKHAYISCAVPDELMAAIKEIVPPEAMKRLYLLMINKPEKKISVRLRKKSTKFSAEKKTGFH